MISFINPFNRYEWMIAIRYLRSKRSDGGISSMTWISLIGISLAVFALIATLAVRTGFRAEFVNTILGANAHASIYNSPYINNDGVVVSGFANYNQIKNNIENIEGVLSVSPVVKGQVMANANGQNQGVEVFGETLIDIKKLPLIMSPELSYGSIDSFEKGIAIGSGIARSLGLKLGDTLTLISPDGVKTAFGTSPRINGFEVVYIFQVGRYDIDNTRIYMPLADAQIYFNSEGRVDEFEVIVNEPEDIDDLKILLLSSMSNGLIMLVKNKSHDIGILRTMGLTEGSILRIFFICGAFTGIIGTVFGVIFGCIFVVYLDPIFNFINYISGGGVWTAEKYLLSNLPAELRFQDILKACSLSLGLTFLITYFPARRAARMRPVEALRYD